MSEKKIIIDARSELGIGKTFLLSLQHVFAMAGATILVPLLIGLNISVTLFCAGIGTLWFHFMTKKKVPIFLGSSFAFLAAFASVAKDETGNIIYEKLPYCTGGILCAGLVYVVLAILIKILGRKKILRLFSPVVTGPIIILIGLILAPSSLNNMVSSGNPMRMAIGVLSILIVIICNIWGRGMIKIMPILISIAISYIIAVIFGVVDFTNIEKNISVVSIPQFMAPKFNAEAIITFVVVSIAAVIEHVGDIAAVSATCDKNFMEEPGLVRTLLGDGIATSIAGLLGGPANTTYSENTGVLAMTKVYDPFVIRIAAIISIVLSLFPIVDIGIRTIPQEIIGGISFILYGMISAVGLRNLIENKVDMTESRNLIVVAIILVSGLAFEQMPIVIAVGNVTIILKGLASAAIFGVIANLILPNNEKKIVKKNG